MKEQIVVMQVSSIAIDVVVVTVVDGVVVVVVDDIRF